MKVRMIRLIRFPKDKQRNKTKENILEINRRLQKGYIMSSLLDDTKAGQSLRR